MGIRPPSKLFAAATLAMAVTAGAIAAAAAPAGAAAGPPARTGIISHATRGCAGAVLLSPRAGAPMSARSLGLPAGAGAFYARAARHHDRWLSSMHCTVHHLTALAPAAGGKTGSAKPAAATISSNWAGYEVLQTAQYVQGTWTVPAHLSGSLGYPGATAFYSAAWDGIGGGANSGTGPLIQAGTEHNVSSTGAVTYYAWYAFGNPSNAEVQIPLAVHAGDIVGDVALWTPAGGAEIGVCNQTTGKCAQVAAGTTSPAPSASAEFIVEAPFQGGAALPLANFASIPFNNSCWAPADIPGATCNALTASNPTRTQLVQTAFGKPQAVAAPGPLTTGGGSNFIVTYFPPERCPTC